MKAIILAGGSTGIENVKVVDWDKPNVAAGEVLIRVHAVSLNFRDLAIIAGKYIVGPSADDLILLSDGAGEVVEVGAGVSRFKAGDKVVGTFFQNWEAGRAPADLAALGLPLHGMAAEYVVLREQGMIALPNGMSYEEGATLPCAGVTAWNALMEGPWGAVKPGETVLCLGTGGVSVFALQFAKMAGARVIMTSSSDEKLERAKALGADATINYAKHPEWHEEVIKATGGKGVDHIVEVGGAGTLPKSYLSVGQGGKISLIGVLSAPKDQQSPHPMMLKGGMLRGIFVGHRQMFENMNAAINVNGLKPVIDKVFAMDEAQAALGHQAAGKHMGKVVIKI